MSGLADKTVNRLIKVISSETTMRHGIKSFPVYLPSIQRIWSLNITPPRATSGVSFDSRDWSHSIHQPYIQVATDRDTQVESATRCTFHYFRPEKLKNQEPLKASKFNSREWLAWQSAFNWTHRDMQCRSLTERRHCLCNLLAICNIPNKWRNWLTDCPNSAILVSTARLLHNLDRRWVEI